MGLPAAMGGDIYLAAGATQGHAAIGRYQESLTPILMDVNGDQMPDFVGTQGVATFTFFVGSPQYRVGSITTADVSYIQGVTPVGQLEVGSQGTIVGSTGLLKGLAGGFQSQSVVGLAPVFDMQTNVHFTVNKPVAPMLTVLSIAADMMSSMHTANATAQTCDTGGATLTQNDGGANHTAGTNSSHVGGNRHDNDSFSVSKPHVNFDAHDAHDSIFGESIDWRPGKSNDLAVL